jgi:hypothetical protein
MVNSLAQAQCKQIIAGVSDLPIDIFMAIYDRWH